MLKNTFAALTAVALVASSAAIAAEPGKAGNETSRPKVDPGVKKGADSGVKKGADSGVKTGADRGKTSSPR